VTKFDWERDGPPRPGSSSMDHPRGIERPYVHVTDEQKRLRREELASEGRTRGRAILAAEWDARFGPDCFNPYRP
jgi:hypothetical protein